MFVCQYDNKFIGRQNTEKISFVPAKNRFKAVSAVRE